MPNLNQFLQPNGAPVTAIQGAPAWKFGIVQRIQQATIRVSNISVKNLVRLSNNGAASASITNGQTLGLSSVLTPQVPQQNFPNHGVPFVALYQGTNTTTPDANFQIYPTMGGSITPGQYTVNGMMDWHLYNGTTSAWGGVITNNTGSTQNIVFITQWKYIQYTNGTVT